VRRIHQQLIAVPLNDAGGHLRQRVATLAAPGLEVPDMAAD
jgi:hypothetical protein